MFGDKKAIEEAIDAAFPRMAEVPEFESKLAHFSKEFASVREAIKRTVKAISRGIINESDADDEMAMLKERESLLSREIDILRTKLDSIPARQEIRIQAQRMHQVVRLRAMDRRYKSAEHFAEMSFKNKRFIVEQAFAGKDLEGNRLGVYVKQATGDGAKWSYTMKGILSDQILGFLPMNKQEEDYLLRRFDPKADLMPQDDVRQDTKSSLYLPRPCLP